MSILKQSEEAGRRITVTANRGGLLCRVEFRDGTAVTHGPFQSIAQAEQWARAVERRTG